MFVPILTLDLFAANGELAKFRNFYIFGANFGKAKSRIPSNNTQFITIIIIIILKDFFIAPKLANRKP
jgi:hypothetical protein